MGDGRKVRQIDSARSSRARRRFHPKPGSSEQTLDQPGQLIAVETPLDRQAGAIRQSDLNPPKTAAAPGIRRRIATLATRMRLTPQSRYGARGADTAARSVGDVEKPWEWNGKRGLE